MNVDELFKQFVESNDTNGPGRGKKLCPECNTYVGVRTKLCACGHAFSKSDRKLTQKEQDALDNQATDEERLYAMSIGSRGGIFTYAMSGPGPNMPKEINQDTIDDYCNEAVFIGLDENKIVTVQAIKHWLMHKLEYNSKEYKRACEHVDVWYNHTLGIDGI